MAGKIALVVGGSGMLARLSQALTEEYDTVGIVGRSKQKMDTLTSEKIVPIFVDYTDPDILKSALEQFTSEYGSPELMVVWVHSYEQNPVPMLVSYTSKDVYEVTSHEGKQPENISHENKKLIESAGLTYHKVILGQVDDRWLTHEEISQGVLNAIKHNHTESIVGEL